MRDIDVRQAMVTHLRGEHADEHDTVLVHEMEVLTGAARIDIALINGELNGYELKSEADTLERLPRQVDIYSRVFDRVSIVAAGRHASKAKRIIPDWWGVFVAEGKGKKITLHVERQPQQNPSPDLQAMCWLLWRDEALAILERHNAARGVRSKPRRAVYERMIDVLPPVLLKREIRQAIKTRSGWRAVRISQPDGD